MGRFRVNAEDDDDDNDNDNDEILENENKSKFRFNFFHHQQHQDDDMDVDDDVNGNHDDEPRGIWRGPIIKMTGHYPQTNSSDNNGMDFPSPHSETSMSFTVPTVSIPRPRQPRRNDDIVNNNNDNQYAMGLRPAEQYQYDPPPPPPAVAWLSWKNILFFALLSHVVARYGPAAPPPDALSDTWEDFWVQELRGFWRTTKLLGFTIPKHVGEWIVVGLVDDARYVYQQYQTRQQKQDALKVWSHCALQIPDTEWNLDYHPGSTSTTSTTSIYQLVGQARAVQVATQALDTWTQSAPLLLYFAGSRGVGKLELARQISQRVFGHCTTTNKATAIDLLWDNGFMSPVLILQGRDFSMNNNDDGDTANNDNDDKDQAMTMETTTEKSTTYSTERAVRIQLYETILRHVQQHPNGTVVIVQHVEETVEGLLATLVQDLTNPSRKHVSTHDRADSYDQQAQQQQSLAFRLQIACRKTIFMFTSHIGSKTIASSIRSYGGIANIPPLELDLMLMHELDTFYVTTSTTSKSSTVEVGSKFHAVAPFFPLELHSMAHILRQKVQEWSHQQHGSAVFPALFEATLGALSALLDSSRVEYLSMVKKTTQTHILTFSSSGAHFLREGSPMMNSWQASVKRCFRDHLHTTTIQEDVPSNDNQESNDDNDYGTLDGNQPKTANNDRAILDYDPDKQEAVVLHCPAPETQQQDVAADQSPCRELCRFSL